MWNNGWNKSHEISLFMEMHTNGQWRVLGPKGVKHRRNSASAVEQIQGKCVLGKRTFLHTFHFTNHRQFVFKQFCCCAVSGTGCVSLSWLCPHLTPEARGGSGAESTALARKPAQELHMLRAPALADTLPLILKHWKYFPQISCCLHEGLFGPELGCQRGDTSSFPPQLPQEGWCILTSSTN